MKRVLIYYRYFGKTLGGGEFIPLAFAEELQNSCEVTLALDWTDGVERAANLFGFNIDFGSRVKTVKVMPPGFHKTMNSPLESLYRFRKLRKLAKKQTYAFLLRASWISGKAPTISYSRSTLEMEISRLPSNTAARHFGTLPSVSSGARR